MDYECKKYSIKNGHLLYLNDIGINAKAGKIKGINLILINCGTIIWQIKNTIENQKLEKYSENYNKVFSKVQFLKFEELSLQINLLFTFYHEFAHILQKSDNSLFWINERNDNAVYSIERHSLEIDADTFSAIHIARHLIDYYEKDFKQFGIKFLEEVTIILCSNLFFYICSFGNSNSDLYYYENSHPHPFIRIMRVLFTIGKYFENDQQIDIKKNEIVEKILDEIFNLQHSKDINNLQKFSEEVSDNYENMFYYLEKTSNFNEINIKSSVRIYNKLAE